MVRDLTRERCIGAGHVLKNEVWGNDGIAARGRPDIYFVFRNNMQNFLFPTLEAPIAPVACS